MRILIVEDEFISRKIMQKFLSQLGDCDIAVDGEEAVDAFRLAWDDNQPYDLVFMDIMMPRINGKEALMRIRSMEKDRGVKGAREVKIIMTTAVEDAKTVFESFRSGATSYLVKPITKEKLFGEIRKLGLIE